MPLPPKTRTSKVGSNLKAHAALAAYEERATAARRKPLVQARKRVQRDERAFLTKSVIRSAAGIERDLRSHLALDPFAQGVEQLDVVVPPTAAALVRCGESGSTTA